MAGYNNSDCLFLNGVNEAIQNPFIQQVITEYEKEKPSCVAQPSNGDRRKCSFGYEEFYSPYLNEEFSLFSDIVDSEDRVKVEYVQDDYGDSLYLEDNASNFSEPSSSNLYSPSPLVS